MVEALYTEEPDAAYLSRIAGRAITVEPLPDQDWIRLSQEGLPPVRAGRFFVYGAHDAGQVPHGVIPMRIEAGLAFGTGHHETTALCLAVLVRSGAADARYRNVLDLGCGTGLLAIGAAKLWKRPVLASDIDPVAIEVTDENARGNGVAPLVRGVVADGLVNPSLARGRALRSDHRQHPGRAADPAGAADRARRLRPARRWFCRACCTIRKPWS